MISETRNVHKPAPVRRIMAAVALLAGALIVAVNAISVGPAQAAGSDTARSADSVGFSIMANNCGFRTSAYPNSWWVASFAPNRCNECPAIAAAYEDTEPGGPWDFYCTYNPSNDLVDLHKRYS